MAEDLDDDTPVTIERLALAALRKIAHELDAQSVVAFSQTCDLFRVASKEARGAMQKTELKHLHDVFSFHHCR